MEEVKGCGLAKEMIMVAWLVAAVGDERARGGRGYGALGRR